MAERLGCPVVSLRSGNGLVFGRFYAQAQPPGYRSGLGPSRYAGHPRPGNGYILPSRHEVGHAGIAGASDGRKGKGTRIAL